MSSDCLIVESGPDTLPSISTPKTKIFPVEPHGSKPSGDDQLKQQPVVQEPQPSTSTAVNLPPQQLTQR